MLLARKLACCKEAMSLLWPEMRKMRSKGIKERSIAINGLPSVKIAGADEDEFGSS